MRWLFALLLLAGFAFAQSQPAPPEQQQQRGAAGQTNSEVLKKSPNFSAPATNVIVSGQVDVKCADEGPESCGKKNYFLRFFDFTLTDCLIALFTGILGIFTVNLARSTQVAAEAAKESAEVTKKAVELSDKTAERQLRAYVYIKHVETIVHGDHRIWTVKLTIRNFGQTPAYKVVTPTAFFFAEKADKYEISLAPPSDLKWSQSNLAPGQEIIVFSNAPRVFSYEETNGFRSGELVIFVHGMLQYQDIFQRTRTTKFRMQYRSDGGFDATPEGNESN